MLQCTREAVQLGEENKCDGKFVPPSPAMACYELILEVFFRKGSVLDIADFFQQVSPLVNCPIHYTPTEAFFYISKYVKAKLKNCHHHPRFINYVIKHMKDVIVTM
jgi:hypothetical protein